MIERREFDFFTVEAQREKSHVDFTIYEGVGYLKDFEEQIKLGIDPALGPSYNDTPLVKGYIKWDGCSNWDFPLEPGVSHPLHFCGLQEVTAFSKMMPELYKWAAKLMPEHHKILE